MSVQTSSKNRVFLEQQNRRESNARSYPRRFPLAMQTAEGIFVTDADGKQYYDCLAGAGTLVLGHNHPVVIEAIQKMIDEKRPLHTLDITSEIKEEFISEVFASLPESFAKRAKIQFCGPTGGDAIEAAIKLVKTATGRRSILSFQGGYHGATHGTMALSGNLSPKENVQGLMPDVHFLPYPYEYRCPFGAGGEETHRLSSAYIENMLDDPESGILPPAGMIFEAVQGEGGSVPARAEWIREMRRITKERGIPLIIDEVQTGIGRTGKMFAFEHAGIIPDVIVLSKAIGGSLPLSVVVYDRDLDQWAPGAHIGTFRGNQMAMAAGTATLKYMKENGILLHVEKAGAKFMQHLQDIQRHIPEIGDVRGRGLMIGAEIVSPLQKQSAAGTPPADPELAAKIQRKCFEKGLIVETGGRHGSVIRFLPPLIVTEEQIADITAIFKEAVYEALK
ncbi:MULTISPECIES: aspartate aminotransferase family protein [Bacillus]|uniref:Diaminobutyrate--2-oxoglutarate transaminase n=1 Tax=Bacillus glycinifermentans TaxID=1664069 RepID=A0AAJ3YWC7_9BACI|nr:MULTISPECIES: aspartate aminotransferase family protein [Bacillus]KKB73396.1 2,4-diaminobutyrate 4-aminotransferase [Bacillus sp. TH008]MDU0069603.1 aspartate aminotransferase family protein [Bacillus sp. IG6]MED8017418.1 aspartate aminotransferase family protein [Bacillus glycinifermentans]QAT64570.1 aspartate aminotransferase family protein [Bacillus glycinifermentans]WKB78520.1 aspartate aminotransferase family protein [Bacillus glycinifermentans]